MQEGTQVTGTWDERKNKWLKEYENRNNLKEERELRSKKSEETLWELLDSIRKANRIIGVREEENEKRAEIT